MNSPTTIGIVVALPEEFELLLEALGDRQTSGPDEASNSYFYKYLENDMQIEGQLVLSFVGKTGPGDAAASTERLAERYAPAMIVSIGISGSLATSVDLADVVVADTVDDYFERPRVSASTADEEYKITPSGGMYTTERQFAEYARNLKFAEKDRFQKMVSMWALNIGVVTNSLPEPARKKILSILDAPRRLHVGSIASSPLLVAATRFKKEVLGSRDRSHLAVDMESAAVGRVCNQLKVPHICVRGISDYADERKRELENQTRGVIRQLAMRNAICAMGAILHSPKYAKKK